MPPVSISSSAILQVDYDPQSQTLTVWFTSGRQYDYFGVPADLYQELLNAPSAGRFFNENIKDQYAVR